MKQERKPRRIRKPSSRHHYLLATIFSMMACVALLTLTACTTLPPPTQALLAAERAISTADQERVSDYALPELAQARDKLNEARAAVQIENMEKAKRLADESRVSAELASAKATRIKAAQINEDMIDSVETLKQEMQRNSGETQ